MSQLHRHPEKGEHPPHNSQGRSGRPPRAVSTLSPLLINRPRYAETLGKETRVSLSIHCEKNRKALDTDLNRFVWLSFHTMCYPCKSNSLDGNSRKEAGTVVQAWDEGA